MDTVPIRELRQHFSAVRRRVRAGEQVGLRTEARWLLFSCLRRQLVAPERSWLPDEFVLRRFRSPNCQQPKRHYSRSRQFSTTFEQIPEPATCRSATSIRRHF